MPSTMSPTRRILLIAFALIAAIILLTTYHSSSPSSILPKSTPSAPQLELFDPSLTLPGTAIAPKLGNETAKAELGRATWKYLHTVMARFPDTPTADESAALKSYIYLFQRLYPCGECASHFGEILAKFPPQVSSRSAAAAWACHVHNEVNKSLGKDIFDCSKIGDFYDCGCADDETEGVGQAKHGKRASEMVEKAQKRRSPGVIEREVDFGAALGIEGAGLPADVG